MSLPPIPLSLTSSPVAASTLGAMSSGPNESGVLYRDSLGLSPNSVDIYEAAAKVLFVSIKWVKSVPSFSGLPVSDQLLLLEAAWPTIFLINLAQWNIQIDEDVVGLTQHSQVEMLQDQSHLMLQEYCQQNTTGIACKVGSNIGGLSKIRFGKLLLALPRLISFDGKSIETLFFKKTVGNIPVDKIVSDLFQGS